MFLITRGLGERVEFEGCEIETEVISEYQIELDVENEFGLISRNNGVASMIIKFKQGEGKSLIFTITKNGDPLDLLGINDIGFAVKRDKRDAEPIIIRKKAEIELIGNIAKLSILNSETKTMAPGFYVGELTIAVSDSDTTKSIDVDIEIEESVTV